MNQTADPTPNASHRLGFKWKLIAHTFAAALGLFASNPVSAATLVSGTVSGTWTKIGSPYMVIDQCTVPGDKTLTVQPGTTVIVGEGLKLTVNGQIIASGTVSNKITFKGTSSSNYWDRIAINHNGTTDSQFAYCDISDADYGLVLNIPSMNSTMETKVSNSIFANCKSACVYAAATGWGNDSAKFWPKNNPIVTNCRFYNSAIGIRTLVEGGSPAPAWYSPASGISNPQIKNCVFEALSEIAISFSAGAYPGGSKPILINNVITDSSIGIETTDPYDFNLYNNIISECKIALTRNGTLSGQVGFNCFFNNNTNFVGYPSAYGKVVLQNQNGIPSDVAMNIFVDPLFTDTVNFTLATNSPCVDAGDATAVYNDKNFPPSLGTAVNDLGAYGGPNAIVPENSNDADGDGLPDSWEVKYFGSIARHGPQADPDGDGLANIDELKFGTDPTKPDTDGDSYSDLVETEAGSDPLDPKSIPSQILHISVEQVRLQFNSGIAQTNIIEASSDLQSWKPIDQLIGTGGIMSRVYSVTNGFRYFRLQRP